MERQLRALLVEDSEYDAELLLRELRRGGFEVTFERVDTAEAMTLALERHIWDIVFCDYSMPHFDAKAAFALMRDKGIDLPFIIVSGTVGEETAVEVMRAGVHDYFLKDKLGPRLIAAIERELREAQVREERRKMQEQLLISDCMVSVGTLAAGVAHEINNPLFSVMINLDLALKKVTERSKKLNAQLEFTEVVEELRDARESTERIRDIVRDLKVFSRSDGGKTGIVDVQRVMESTLRMAWNEIRHRARLVKNYETTAPIEASESRLGQVFLNLVVNAAQAIAEGRAAHNEIRITIGPDTKGDVVVEIADTGHGMTPEVMARLFTPFFTTKPVGIGLGLGLSICHRIITDLGGTITVNSEVGKGTVFRVSLPAARVEPSIHETPETPNVIAAKRRGKVLVIDDEPVIIKSVKRVLSSEHDVITTTSAEEALKRIQEGERFDVILCDLMMPHMTGMDLYAALFQHVVDQAQRVIFLTGGAFTPRARSFLDETPNQRLEKPFDAMHLRALVNDRIR